MEGFGEGLRPLECQGLRDHTVIGMLREVVVPKAFLAHATILCPKRCMHCPLRYVYQNSRNMQTSISCLSRKQTPPLPAKPLVTLTCLRNSDKICDYPKDQKKQERKRARVFLSEHGPLCLLLSLEQSPQSSFLPWYRDCWPFPGLHHKVELIPGMQGWFRIQIQVM